MTKNLAAVEQIPIVDALIKKPEVAKAISTTERTVENLMNRRAIPFVRFGRCVRFHLPSVIAALRRFETKEVQ